MKVLAIGYKLLEAIHAYPDRSRCWTAGVLFGLDESKYDVRHVDCYLSFDLILSSYRLCLLHLAQARCVSLKHPRIILATSAKDHLDQLITGNVCDAILEPEVAVRAALEILAGKGDQFQVDQSTSATNHGNASGEAKASITRSAFVQFMSYVGIGAHGATWWDQIDDEKPTMDEKDVARRVADYYIRRFEEFLPDPEINQRIKVLKDSPDTCVPSLFSSKRLDIVRRIGNVEIRVSSDTAYRQAKQYYREKERRNMERYNLKVIKPIFKAARNEDITEFSRAFMIMPFDVSLTRFYEEIVKSTATDCGIQISRADDFFTTGQVMEDVWNRINEANLVIADLTGRNPNVFYELGIAHTLGKPVILLSQTIADVPFDVRHHRVITYSTNFDQIAEFRRRLKDSIESVRKEYIETTGLVPLGNKVH